MKRCAEGPFEMLLHRRHLDPETHRLAVRICRLSSRCGRECAEADADLERHKNEQLSLPLARDLLRSWQPQQTYDLAPGHFADGGYVL